MPVPLCSEPAEADACLSILYRRFYPRVAGWCLRFCGDRQEAADVAHRRPWRRLLRIGSSPFCAMALSPIRRHN